MKVIKHGVFWISKFGKTIRCPECSNSLYRILKIRDFDTPVDMMLVAKLECKSCECIFEISRNKNEKIKLQEGGIP